MDLQTSKNHQNDLIFTTDQLSQSLIPKLQPIVNLLNQQIVDIKQLRWFMNDGISDQARVIREYVWKLVLGYLPKERMRWKQTIQKQEKVYHQFLGQFISAQKYKEAPLILNKKDSQWLDYQKDYFLWQQIQKDTCRTQAELSFFSAVAPKTLIPFFTNTRREKHRLINGQSGSIIPVSKQDQKMTYRFDYLTRILFVFARLNPKVEYVQGMNELLAPIFYLVHSPQSQSKCQAVQEAACFFMFNNVMTDILQLHMRDFGKQQNSVHGRMQHIGTMLLALEPKVWQKLDILKIDPFYYSFRWITLLFSQQFQMYQTLRIWESIFSHDDRTRFANFFALALILSSKHTILHISQYGQILAYLKAISEHVAIQQVLTLANQLYQKYGFVDLAELAFKNRLKLQKQLQRKGDNRLIKFFKKLF